MEFNQLLTFLRVIEEGGFSRAASAQHLTQPAVSQQIRALESGLGVELFHRTGRSARPTRAGKVLRDYAQTIVATAERAQAALDEFRTDRHGRLCIGAGNTTITFRLPPLLREFRRRRPAVEVVVKAGNSDALLALLDQEAVDVALVTSPADAPGLIKTPLYSDEVILILPGDHSPPTVDLTPPDLADLPSILFTRDSGFRRFLDAAFVRAGYQPAALMEVDSIEGIKSLVQAGLGLSFLPRVAVQKELTSGELRTAPVAGLVPLHRTTYAVYRVDNYMSAPLKSFLGLLADNYTEKNHDSAFARNDPEDRRLP